MILLIRDLGLMVLMNKNLRRCKETRILNWFIEAHFYVLHLLDFWVEF